MHSSTPDENPSLDLSDTPKLLTYTFSPSDDSALSTSFGGAKLQSVAKATTVRKHRTAVLNSETDISELETTGHTETRQKARANEGRTLCVTIGQVNVGNVI